jgi:ankyrin repeat protein
MFSALSDAILNVDIAAPTVQLLIDSGADVNLQGGDYGCPLGVSVIIYSGQFTSGLWTSTSPGFSGCCAQEQPTSGRAAAWFGNWYKRPCWWIRVSTLPLAKRETPLTSTRSSILQLSVIEGDLDIFRLLLTHGADPNAESEYNITALAAAARFKHDTMLNELLEHGADPTLDDSCALVAAVSAGNDNAAAILLERGREVYDKKGYPAPALIAAVKGGFVELCRRLLDLGADVNMVEGAHG